MRREVELEVEELDGDPSPRERMSLLPASPRSPHRETRSHSLE